MLTSPHTVVQLVDETLKDARFFVTGADGFMGSALVESLLRRGARVGAAVRRTSRSTIRGHLRNLAAVSDRLELVVHADLAEVDWYLAAQRWQPTHVLHLAADAYVPASFTAPREVLRANALATLNVLEFCRSAEGVRRVVVLSSSEIYGPSAEPIGEELLPQPTTPYAASKLAADRLSYSYWRSFGLPVVICRPFNSYGPRHPYDVIPRFLQAALFGRPMVINGDGSQSRDFMYVDDIVDGLVRAATTAGIEGEVFNFGTGVSTSIRRLAETVLAVSGTRVPIVHTEARPGEVFKLECNPARATRVLGWAPAVTLADGIARTWEWTVRNRDYLAGVAEKPLAEEIR